jgi:hypothetical protein
MTDIVTHDLVVLSGQSAVTGGESNVITSLNPNGASGSYTPTNPFYLTDVGLGLDGATGTLSIRSAGDTTNIYRFNAAVQDSEPLAISLKTPIIFPAGQEISLIVNYDEADASTLAWTLVGYEASL